ncbi:MAG: signal peptidase I [Syntrophomonadaceae bacterium]|nr:signal peptidase I [Syntrophomonadaceae bacterium]
MIILNPGPKLTAPSKPANYTIILLLLYLSGYLLTNRLVGLRMSALVGNYVMPAMVWGVVAIFVAWLPGTSPQGKLRFKRLLGWLALMCVVISLLGMLLQGAVSSLGKSPYDHSLMGIMINLLTQGPAIVAFETGRAWLLNRHFARRPLPGMVLVSLLFGLLAFPVNDFARLAPGKPLVEFTGQQLCPALGQSVLASYLAWLGGPLPAIIYRGGLSALEYLSPILPNSEWISQTLLGVLTPVLGLVMVHSIYGEESRSLKPARRDDSHLTWVLTGLAAILIVWFSLGVFSYQPKVIMTGSMEPLISPGDMVIVNKTDKQVEVGDIIMFPLDQMKITHRVVAVQESADQRFFTTKGDANPGPDLEPVPEQKVQGKVVLVVPKIGQPARILHGGL